MGNLSRGESKKRQATIQGMILDGLSNHAIIQLAADEWKIKERQVYNYIKKINDEWENEAEETMRRKRKRAIDRSKRLYYKCVVAGDRRAAATVLKEIHDIEAVKTIKVDLSGAISITDMLKKVRNEKSDT